MIELLSMWNLTRIEVQLCNMLPPEASPLSLASYKWCLSPEREKSGARTKRKSPNEEEFSWNEAASGCERRNGAAIKSERFYGRRDRSVASTEEKVSWVNEGFLRLPKSELMIVAWLTSLLDGLSMPTSSVGTSAKLEITSELRFTKFRECDIDEEDCS